MIRPGIVVAVDFDGTIVTHEYPAIGKPLPYCIETLKKIESAGGKIILLTMRDGKTLDDALKYLEDNGIKPLAANVNPDQHTWSNSRKVYAHIYIDDAADLGCYTMYNEEFSNRRFVDWATVDALLFPEE